MKDFATLCASVLFSTLALAGDPVPVWIDAPDAVRNDARTSVLPAQVVDQVLHRSEPSVMPRSVYRQREGAWDVDSSAWWLRPRWSESPLSGEGGFGSHALYPDETECFSRSCLAAASEAKIRVQARADVMLSFLAANTQLALLQQQVQAAAQEDQARRAKSERNREAFGHFVGFVVTAAVLNELIWRPRYRHYLDYRYR